MNGEKVVESTKVWTTLITNTSYLPGLLTLAHSLQKSGTSYPLIALYTSAFPAAGHAALDRRNIAKQHIPYLLPNVSQDYTHDPRFHDCWSKLAPFGLTGYERVVQLDSDMLVRRNMDELMDLPLDAAELGGQGERVFAASHACVCNPLGKAHYPPNWTPAACAFTTQHNSPDEAQSSGAPATAGLGMPNGGLQVVNPSAATYALILARLQHEATGGYEFADQSLLGDVFAGRWVAVPYVYNALKTMRWKGVHDAIWRDGEVKNVHYILSPKPWEEGEGEGEGEGGDESHRWWREMDLERKREERERGIDDGF